MQGNLNFKIWRTISNLWSGKVSKPELLGNLEGLKICSGYGVYRQPLTLLCYMGDRGKGRSSQANMSQHPKLHNNQTKNVSPQNNSKQNTIEPITAMCLFVKAGGAYSKLCATSHRTRSSCRPHFMSGTMIYCICGPSTSYYGLYARICNRQLAHCVQNQHTLERVASTCTGTVT
jgi:hypothetical protein